MKKIARFAIIFYLLTLLAPVALAVDEWTAGNLCPYRSIDQVVYTETETLPGSDYYDDISTELEGNIDENNCGKKRGNDLLEKADCTAANMVITEISEVIGSEGITIGDDPDNPEAKVVDVYAGQCCLVAQEKSITESDGKKVNKVVCQDSRTIYTEDFETCNNYSINCQQRQWLIGSTGAGIIKLYIKQMYNWAVGVIGMIAVVTLVISSVQISVSGVSGDISAAKNRITKSLLGIVLLFLSGIILYVINPSFFGS